MILETWPHDYGIMGLLQAIVKDGVTVSNICDILSIRGFVSYIYFSKFVNMDADTFF